MGDGSSGHAYYVIEKAAPPTDVEQFKNGAAPPTGMKSTRSAGHRIVADDCRIACIAGRTAFTFAICNNFDGPTALKEAMKELQRRQIAARPEEDRRRANSICRHAWSL